MSHYDDPGLYRWTELHPDAAEIAAGRGVGQLVRVLSATEVVAEGACRAVSLSTAVGGAPVWRFLLDGVPVHVAPGHRAFAAVPIPAVPRHPQPRSPRGTVVPAPGTPAARDPELETTLAEACAARDAAQACAEEAAALLETVRARVARPVPRPRWWHGLAAGRARGGGYASSGPVVRTLPTAPAGPAPGA